MRCHYELNVHASVNESSGTIGLTFSNSGHATAVFHVRSGNPSDVVRTYTVEPGKHLTGSWNASPSYNLSVYGPNGFARYFNGSTVAGAAALDVRSEYDTEDGGEIELKIKNVAGVQTEVTVLNAYTGNLVSHTLHSHETIEEEVSLGKFHGWYDLIVTVAGDSTFKYELAGHVETGKDSFSDPALGGLVTLKN